MSTMEAKPSDSPKQRAVAEADGGGQAPAAPATGSFRRARLARASFLTALLLAGIGLAGWYWWQEQLAALPDGFAKANGRLESEQVEIATKYAGRIATVLVREGEMIDAGQVVARMDTAELEAQLHSAQAQLRRAEHEQTQAEHVIVQRDSERTFARQELERTAALVKKGWSTREKLDQRQSEMRTAQAAYETAIASLDASKAMIAAGQAEVVRIQEQIDDSTLVAPRRGRIQYKLAQPGEVLAAGGRVVTVLDLSEVYMTIFVPARVAGPLALGDEARVVLDPLPDYVFPANVTFVATEAQFTPKTVETEEEREKLMFRVKLTIDPELRTRYEQQVKTGIRGVGFVRMDRDAAWPENLTIKLP